MLKERGWADGLSAGAGLDHRAESTFSVYISLTQEGETVFPSLVVAYPWRSIGLLVLAVVVATGGVIVGIRTQVNRLDAGRSAIGDMS